MTTTISGQNDGGTIVWQGFDYGWRGEPHRLSRLGSHLDSFALQPDGRTVRARYISDFGVGNVDDSGDAVTSVSSLISQPLSFVNGFQTKKLNAELGKVSTASDEAVSVQLPGSGDLVATPLLRGFDIAVTNFPSGFQTRGFGVQLIPGPLSGNVFPLHTQLHHSPGAQPRPADAPPDWRRPVGLRVLNDRLFYRCGRAPPRNSFHVLAPGVTNCRGRLPGPVTSATASQGSHRGTRRTSI